MTAISVTAFFRQATEVSEGIHRGIDVRLTPEDHAIVHDASRPLHERAQHLLDAVTHEGYEPLGQHWTTDRETAEGFAHYNGGKGADRTKVVFHAHHDPEGVEHDPGWRQEHEVNDLEDEVPLKKGADVTVHSISWRENDRSKHWNRHTFAEPEEFLHTAAQHPAPTPESYARQDGEGFEHDDRIRRGLSLGHITYDQARGHGFLGGSDENPNYMPGRGWQPLPQALYHTTTDSAGVAARGLRSGKELGQRKGHGLGGSPGFVSMTDSAEHAHTMLNALHEYHDVLSGKTSISDLHEAAQRGEGADKPFHEGWEAMTGKKVLEAAKRGRYRINGAWTDDTAAEQGFKPTDDHKRVTDWEGKPAGQGWERDFTPEEHMEARHNAYDNFSYARQRAGGPKHILFTSNDKDSFAKKDPSNFAVVKVRPKRGAQGYPMPGEHEWRTATGDAVETHGEPLRRTSARIGEAFYDEDDGHYKNLWDRWHPQLPPTMHRHLALDLPADHPAHDTSLPTEQRAQAIVDHAAQGAHGSNRVGYHWTSDPNYDHLAHGGRIRSGQTHVILHAQTPPREHIEDNEHVLTEGRAVRDWDMDEEREVPVKRNAPIAITGVSWRSGEERNHHSFDAPLTKRAARQAVQHGDDIPSGLLNPHGHHISANVGGYTNVEMVPRTEIERYASQETTTEHTREVGHHVATTGSMEPLMLQYHPATGEAYLGEGNHRLRAARHLQMDHVPLRVSRNVYGLGGTGVPTPQRHPAQEAGGHVPADIRPSDLGIGTGQQRTAKELGIYGPPDRWYHASPHDLEETGFEEGHVTPGHDEIAGKHWNSHLGIHLTSHHETARDLAEETYGTVHHVTLHASNPRHYRSEDDLTDEVHAWASKHPDFHRDLPADDDDDMMTQTQKHETALRGHPRIADVAQGFRQHLRNQGHDAITYGNTYEGPKGHLCAIAFHPDDARIDGAHSWDDHESCEHLDKLPARTAAGSTPCPDCQGRGEDAAGRECDPCDGQGHITTPVPHNTTPYEHQHDWLPSEHFFAPGKKGLDPRLFSAEGGDHMHPEVRLYLLALLHHFWAPRYGDTWQSWARVYLAGGAASHFWGDNDDLDVLIGVDFDAARHHVDALTGEPDGAISTRLTDELKAGLNDEHRMLPAPGGGESGPWESTFFVLKPGPGGDPADIRRIHPYAAYDITGDTWAVRPVETGDDFSAQSLPESSWDIVDAVRKLVDAVAELPAGVREREGAALYDYLHADRSAAFGPEGSGLYDPANTTWKALVAAPGGPLQQLIDWKHAHDAPARQEAAA